MPNVRKMKNEHLILNTELTSMDCLCCGAKQKIPIPVYLDIFIAMMKAFEKSHSHCQKTTNEDPGILSR